MQTHSQHGQSAVLEHPAWPPPVPELEDTLEVELDVLAELVVAVACAPPEPIVAPPDPWARELAVHAPASGVSDAALSKLRMRAASRRAPRGLMFGTARRVAEAAPAGKIGGRGDPATQRSRRCSRTSMSPK
jgi:hypothetical protein